MKSTFLASQVVIGVGVTSIVLKNAPGGDNDFVGGSATSDIPIKVFGTQTLFQQGKTYEVEVTEYQANPDAASTQQLTENNNNLNNTEMSIFTKIGDFLAALVNEVKKLWQKLDPVIKTDVNTVLTVSNLILANLDKPASVVLTLLENIIGDFATGKIKAILTTVSTDLGLAAKVADQSDPEAALQVIIDELSSQTGNKLLDTVENMEKYLTLNLNPDELSRETAGQVTAYAKAHFFTPQASTQAAA